MAKLSGSVASQMHCHDTAKYHYMTRVGLKFECLSWTFGTVFSELFQTSDLGNENNQSPSLDNITNNIKSKSEALGVRKKRLVFV